MNRRGKPPVFALTTFSLLAVAASVGLAFMAAEVYNIGAPAQVVGPNATDVLAMDIFLADNPVRDVKIMPGERASALGDAISYFDFTNGFAGYVNIPLVAGDAGEAFPANTIFANRGNPGDNVPTGQDDQKIADELWEDLNTDGYFDVGETEVWWETQPVDGTRGYDLRTWATAAYGFVPATDELYFKNAAGMHVNTPMWIDFDEDGPAGVFEWEEVIFPLGGGGSALDGTAADPAGPTFGDTPEREVWGDMNGDETFNTANDVIWDDDRANNMYDNEPVIHGVPTHGDVGTSFPANVMFENEDNDATWNTPGEDLFRDINGNDQWDIGETNYTGGGIIVGAPGTQLSAEVPEYMFVDNGPAGFDFPGDEIFIDTNGNGEYELETMMLGAAPPNGTPGTAFQDGWTFNLGYTLIWVDGDTNDEYDADLVVFGAPRAHPSDPAPVQPLLYDGDEEIFVDNIPAAVGFTGNLSLDPDDALNPGQDGVNAAHGAPLSFFPDPQTDGFERFADLAPLGEYNDGDEIFEDHDNSMTYTAQGDGRVGGDDGLSAVTWAVGAPLPLPAANLSFLDLNFDDVLSDNEPVVNESMENNLTMDPNESVIANFSGPLTTFPSNVWMIDINSSGSYQNGEPIFDNVNEDDFVEPGEASLRRSAPFTLIPMTPFTNVEFFIGGLADYNDGDDIVEIVYPGSGAHAGGDRIYNLYGPDGISGVGGDDILWFDTNANRIFQPSQDDAFIDRNNNRRLDGGTMVPFTVLGGDPDIGEPIVPLIPFTWRFNDLDGSTGYLVAVEPCYADVNTNNTVGVGDKRILWYQPGTAVTPSHEDVGAPFAQFANAVVPGPAQTIYLDLDGSTGYTQGEPVYYYGAGFAGAPNPGMVSSDAVGAAVVRLNEAAFVTGFVANVYPPLSLVHDGDQELVAPGALFEYFSPTGAPGSTTYYDGNTNGVFNPGELVYYDVAVAVGIHAGDFRIYVYPAGSAVAANNVDLGIALAGGGGGWPALIAVRDGWGGTPRAYDAGEQIYANNSGRFLPYTPGNDGFDGFNVSDVLLDFRLTARPFEWRVIDGGGFAALGSALAPMTEDLIRNGSLDSNLDETALDETVLGVDLNQDGDTADTAVIWDMTADGNADVVFHEDENWDGILTGPHGNNFFTRAPFTFGSFFATGGGPFFTPGQDIFRIIRDGNIAGVLPGSPIFGLIKNIGGLVKHFDDGGRGHIPMLPPLYTGFFNFRFDDGEGIVFDTDDDLRWDPGEAVLTASAMPINPATGAILVGAIPAVMQMNAFSLPQYLFADVEGGVANGLYDQNEAIIEDLNDNGRWQNGEVVLTSSADGHLNDFTFERRAPAGNDFVLDWDLGGTWSGGADTPRDLVDGLLDTNEGDPLTTFPADVGYHNVLGVNEYDDFENDEIFQDLDGDGLVTVLSDTKVYPLAGPFTSANGDVLNQFVAVPPAPAGANRFAGWVDTGNGVYNGDATDEEDIFYDVDGDGVVDELDDVMSDFALMNPLSANEPTDIVAVRLWMEDGTTPGFQAGEDTEILPTPGVVDPMDSRSWTWTGLSVPVPSEDRNGDGDDNDVLNEALWSIDFNDDGDLLDIVTEAHPQGRTDTDSQTRMYATIDISADPQNLLIGNQFDATIPLMGVETLALNNGPEDVVISNSLGVMGGVITIDDYPPTVTRLEQLWLNDFDSNVAPGIQAPNVIAPGDNRYEVSGEVRLVFRTPSDNDVRRVKMMWATDEGGPWMPVDTDPNHGTDIGSDGEPGLIGIDDDGDWVAATGDLGADGLALTGDAGEGNGIPDVGEPGVDRKDPQVAAAFVNHLNDGLDNNDDGYIDDFEYEPVGKDVDRDGLVGEGFPEANQTNGLDDDADGIVDDDGVDVNDNGTFGEPDPTVGPGGDSDYLTMFQFDNDEDGIADADGTEFMAQLVNDNFWNIPDSTVISFTGGPTLWSFTLDTRLLQYVFNETATLPASDDLYVKAVAYDLFGNVMPLYAAPAALRLDNLAPAATVAMTDMLGTPVNDGDQVLDSDTYLVGVTSPDDELLNIVIKWAKNTAATFANTLGTIQDVNEKLSWSPDAVGNNPPDDTDDYYWEATASDILAWWNETTQQWQPYAYDLDGNSATDPTFIGNAEMSALPVCYPAIVQTCLLPEDVAELHVEALNATAPLSAITQIQASPPEIRARGDFANGVRVPAYNAVLLFVDNEDINENGVLNAALNEAALNEVVDGVDYNKDGDKLDVGVAADLNFDGDMTDVINEDANGNTYLDDGIDDGDGKWWTSDIVGCLFEQTPVNENNWVPIETVTGDTIGGVVQDLSYPVAVSWDTRDLAASEVSYNLRVRAWDVEDNWLDEGIEIVTVTVDATGLNAYFNQDPTEVTNPATDGSTVYGTINLYAYSVDPFVTRVLFRYSDDDGATWNDITVDNNPDAGFGGNPTIYRDWGTTFNTSLFPDGDYLFDVVGLDEYGNSDEDPTDPGQQMDIAFMNTPPIVAITSPAAGTIVSMLNGNVNLDMEAELQPVAAGMNAVAAAVGEIDAQFQYSINGGVTWQSIDGINGEVEPFDVQPGDYFADNPRKGLRMGAYNRHYPLGAFALWAYDMRCLKGLENKDYGMLEVGDWRVTGNPWTDPMYAASTWVAEGDQDVGTPLTPFVGPIDAGDAVEPAPERFSPFTTTFYTNEILGDSNLEMPADKVVLLRVYATYVLTGLSAAGPSTEITVRENSDPLVDLIEVTDSAGEVIVESEFEDHSDIVTQFPGGYTFADQITIFARAADNTATFTEQQGTVAQLQVFYRPRQVDYNYTGIIEWMPGPVDNTYPFIMDMDVSGMNGLYEFGIQGTDEGGNTSGIYPQFSCVIEHFVSTATGLPATINEGATITIGGTVVSAPAIDGDLPIEARFYRSAVVLDEEVAPEFQTGGTYAGFFTALLEEDVVNDMDPGSYPAGSSRNFVTIDGRDVRVDVGGTAGVYYPFNDLSALPAPTCYDFAIDYTVNSIIFGADPTACGDVTVDYHSSSWTQFGSDEIAPYTADLTMAFGASGDYDVICVLFGTNGAASPTTGIFTRPVALSANPGGNYEPAFGEWNLLTVLDAEAPLFTIGGLGRLATDDAEFASRWTGYMVNLGNSVNNADGGPETILSGDEMDAAIYESGEYLDPASIIWTLRDAAGAAVASGAFAAIGGSDGVPYVHPITFTLFENDFAQVVEGDDFENVRLWLDFNGDNNWSSDEAEINAEVFPLTDMGDFWQTTVEFGDWGLVEYMFLVDTIGNDLDFDHSGAEDPVDDPRNQLPVSMGGDGFEIDQNNGGGPEDSRINTLEDNGYWANADITALADGVYFFDFTADDLAGNPTTYTKRVVIDRTAFPQDFITVSTANEVYVGMPGSVATLFAKIIDPASPDVNVVDAFAVTFQYFDGVDWLWCNGGAGNTSANAIDIDPTDGWSIDWAVPDPSVDLKDNDGDGYVDEDDEGEFTVQLRAVVRDLGFNLSHTPDSGERDFTIDSIAPETSITLARVEGDAAPTPADGKVVTLGEWVDLYAPEPSGEAPEAVVFQYHLNANAGSEPSLPAMPEAWVSYVAPAKGEADTYTGNPIVLDYGGPNAFGYTWKDSDEFDGPDYNWVEIAGVGTNINLTGDDNYLATALPIGFDFPYYGNTFDEFWISTNGWISFTAPGTSDLSNSAMGTGDGVANMLALWWDDLDFDVTKKAWYLADGNRLIVEYVDAVGYNGDGPVTFQVILYPDGRILLQYKEMQPGLTGSTIGIQNATLADGLTVVFNAAYMHDLLAVQISPPGVGMGTDWVDIDLTPLDPDDDYTTGAGAVHETPDYTADTNVGGDMYYMGRFQTELIRHILQGSGDLFAEVRALGVDAVGNEGTNGGTTVLVINDMAGPATVVYGVETPGIGFRYANDPTLVLGGTVTVWTAAVGYNYDDVATTTLQISTTGGDDWSDWTTLGTAVPDIYGQAPFAVDFTSYSGTVYLRAFSTDKDGNIGGDTDADGIIDSDEAENLHVVALTVNNGMPEMALHMFGAQGHTLPGLSDGDIIMPNLLPMETEFQPVLPQNVAVAAWNASDESPDVWSCDLQFFNDVADPTSPEWVTIADMTYRDTPGDYGPAGAPADGIWKTEFASMEALRLAMEAALSSDIGSREYRLRALVTTYAGITNHAEEGVLLMFDPYAAWPWDIAVGDEDMEGGGGGWNLPSVQVAGGDMVPIQAYVPDSWDEWIPGSGAPVDPGWAWESAGMYGVRARVATDYGAWETVGLLALDETANLPATYVIDWETPLNVAWGDTMYHLEISSRDEAGNYAASVRDFAIIVQDATPPDGTELTNIYVASGDDGATFPNPVTETTIRTEGTHVRGEVTLVAATAAGDQSISYSNSEVFFQVKPDGGDWILINAGEEDTNFVNPGAVEMSADMAQQPGAGGMAHLGLFWKVAWNTLVVDGDGDYIFPDGHYKGRAWTIDDWGNHELLSDVGEIDIWVDNTAPMAQMDAAPYTAGVQTTATVERNDVFTAFARTVNSLGAEVVDDDVVVKFWMKLSTDMNVETSWRKLGPGYDATDVNPDDTRPYSFDWWMNQNLPPLIVGAKYNLAGSAWDLLGSTETEVEAFDAGRGITITIVDTQAPVATITKLVRSIGDPTVITWPDEICIVGIDSLQATILRGDTDTKFVRFYYRREGTTPWILADGDIIEMGDLTWVLYNWDSSGLVEGRYDFMARAEDDAGNVADGPVITLIINRTGPVFVAVEPESDALPEWEPSLSAASAAYADTGMVTQISPVGPQPYAEGRMAPTGSYTGSDSRTYTVTISGNGNVGAATFDWASSSGENGTDISTGSMVPLEDGIMVSFCDGTETPSFEIGDVFTFNTMGKTVDLIVTTSVGMDDIDRDRVFFEYKLSNDPDLDAYWKRDAISPCGVLHDDMLNTWTSKWDISGLESCLYDIRLTMWDVCGNWTTEWVAEKVIVDNDCPPVAITNIENADENDTSLEPIDFGQITDVTRGVPVEIWATATDDEPCLPESHETGITKMQWQMASDYALGGSGMADVLFMFDTTGSMGSEQAKAKAAAAAFANALAATGVNFQLGLVDLDGVPSTSTRLLDLTSDTNAFIAAVNALDTSGGSIYSYDAITGALSGSYGLSWRTGAQKYLILVTDTSPEGGTGSGVDFCTTPTPSEETNLIATVGQQAIVMAIVEAPASDDSGCPEDQNCYDGITTATGGMLFDLNAADYTPLLMQVASEIAAGVAGAWQDLGLYEVPEDAGDDPDVTASQLWDTSGLVEGTYYLRVQAWDEADNICYSQVVQVNIVDKTPPIARIGGFDPDVLHGDDENTLERVYAMVYSDDEIVDVQFQYNLNPTTQRWVTFGMGTSVDAGDFDPLEQNNVPEVWASDFNLSDLIALTTVNVGSQFYLRAVAKDSDSNRIDDYRSDRNSPELTVTVVTSPIDGSLALCPTLNASRIPSMGVSSPREDNVLLSVTTDAVNEVPRVLVVWEDLLGEDVARVLPMDRTLEIPSSTFQGNVDLAGVMDGGQVAIFATAVQIGAVDIIHMKTKSLVVHPVDDALGSNGVAGVPRTNACATAGPLGASVEIPPGNGQEGGLYIGPADLDVPRTPEAQSYYIERYGDAYYIDLFRGDDDFTIGYEAEVVITYDDPDPEDEGYQEWAEMEKLLAPRYWGGDSYESPSLPGDGIVMEGDAQIVDVGWMFEGISHVKINIVTNQVSFYIDNLVEKNFFSLFLPTGEAPIEVADYTPWSEGYTNRVPEIRVMLEDIFGSGVDESSVELYIDGRIMMNSGTGWVLGDGDYDLNQVRPDGTLYELVYEHSKEDGDKLAGGMHQLLVKFENTAGEKFTLDPAAPLAGFGVDMTPVRYWWDPGVGSDGETLNFVLGRNPVIKLAVSDWEAGVHIQDNWISEHRSEDGIKMDVYKVETSQYEPDGPNDVYYARNLVQTGSTDMLVFDPPIDEYDPAVDDTLRIMYPMYDVNLDAFNGQELEVVIYTQRTSDGRGSEDPYDDVNNYDLAVKDRVGNVGSRFVEHRYRIDVCGPTVTFVTPECDATIEPDEDIIVTIDLSDECSLCEGDCNETFVFLGSGIDPTSIRYEIMTPADTVMTGREVTVTGERITFTLPGPLMLGDYTLTVWVSDVLGNTTTADCSFTVSGDGDRLLADAYIYPNPLDPSNGGGTFVVNAGQPDSKVSIDVYDFAGGFVTTVARDVKVTAWGFEIPWDGRAEDGTMLASGPYMARVRVENGTDAMSKTVKVMLWQLDN